MEKLSFLTAPRFHALVIGAVIYYLKTKGFIGDQEMILVETILGGFWATRTIDRASEFIGGAREINKKIYYTNQDDEKVIDKQSEVDTNDAG